MTQLGFWEIKKSEKPLKMRKNTKIRQKVRKTIKN
jgi:hypothetical protein